MCAVLCELQGGGGFSHVSFSSDTIKIPTTRQRLITFNCDQLYIIEMNTILH